MIYSYVASHVALLPASSRCLFVSVSESSAGPPVRSPSLGADDASRGSGADPSAAAVPELRGHAPARGLFQCPIRCIICGVAYRSPAGRVVELSPSGGHRPRYFLRFQLASRGSTGHPWLRAPPCMCAHSFCMLGELAVWHAEWWSFDSGH